MAIFSKMAEALRNWLRKRGVLFVSEKTGQARYSKAMRRAQKKYNKKLMKKGMAHYNEIVWNAQLEHDKKLIETDRARMTEKGLMLIQPSQPRSDTT